MRPGISLSKVFLLGVLPLLGCWAMYHVTVPHGYYTNAWYCLGWHASSLALVVFAAKCGRLVSDVEVELDGARAVRSVHSVSDAQAESDHLHFGSDNIHSLSARAPILKLRIKNDYINDKDKGLRMRSDSEDVDGITDEYVRHMEAQDEDDEVEVVALVTARAIGKSATFHYEYDYRYFVLWYIVVYSICCVLNPPGTSVV